MHSPPAWVDNAYWNGAVAFIAGHISRAIVWATNFLRTFPTQSLEPSNWFTSAIVRPRLTSAAMLSGICRCANFVAHLHISWCYDAIFMFEGHGAVLLLAFHTLRANRFVQVKWKIRFQFFRLIGRGFCGSVVSQTHFEVPGASPRWQEFQLLPGGSIAPSNDAVPTSQCKPVFFWFSSAFRAVFVRHTNDWHLTDRSSPHGRRLQVSPQNLSQQILNVISRRVFLAAPIRECF